MGGLLRYTNAIVGMGLVGIGIAMIASPELVVPEMYGKKKNGQRVKGEPSTAWVAIGCFEVFMGTVLCMSFYWGKDARFGLGLVYLLLMCALMYDLSENAPKAGLAPFGLNNFTYAALIFTSCWYVVALIMNRLEPGYLTADKKTKHAVEGEKSSLLGAARDKAKAAAALDEERVEIVTYGASEETEPVIAAETKAKEPELASREVVNVSEAAPGPAADVAREAEAEVVHRRWERHPKEAGDGEEEESSDDGDIAIDYGVSTDEEDAANEMKGKKKKGKEKEGAAEATKAEARAEAETTEATKAGGKEGEKKEEPARAEEAPAAAAAAAPAEPPKPSAKERALLLDPQEEVGRILASRADAYAVLNLDAATVTDAQVADQHEVLELCVAQCGDEDSREEALDVLRAAHDALRSAWQRGLYGMFGYRGAAPKPKDEPEEGEAVAAEDPEAAAKKPDESAGEKPEEDAWDPWDPEGAAKDPEEGAAKDLEEGGDEYEGLSEEAKERKKKLAAALAKVEARKRRAKERGEDEEFTYDDKRSTHGTVARLVSPTLSPKASSQAIAEEAAAAAKAEEEAAAAAAAKAEEEAAAAAKAEEEAAAAAKAEEEADAAAKAEEEAAAAAAAKAEEEADAAAKAEEEAAAAAAALAATALAAAAARAEEEEAAAKAKAEEEAAAAAKAEEEAAAAKAKAKAEEDAAAAAAAAQAEEEEVFASPSTSEPVDDSDDEDPIAAAAFGSPAVEQSQSPERSEEDKLLDAAISSIRNLLTARHGAAYTAEQYDAWARHIGLSTGGADYENPPLGHPLFGGVDIMLKPPVGTPGRVKSLAQVVQARIDAERARDGEAKKSELLEMLDDMLDGASIVTSPSRSEIGVTSPDNARGRRAAAARAAEEAAAEEAAAEEAAAAEAKKAEDDSGVGDTVAPPTWVTPTSKFAALVNAARTQQRVSPQPQPPPPPPQFAGYGPYSPLPNVPSYDQYASPYGSQPGYYPQPPPPQQQQFPGGYGGYPLYASGAQQRTPPQLQPLSPSVDAWLEDESSGEDAAGRRSSGGDEREATRASSGKKKPPSSSGGTTMRRESPRAMEAATMRRESPRAMEVPPPSYFGYAPSPPAYSRGPPGVVPGAVGLPSPGGVDDPRRLVILRDQRKGGAVILRERDEVWLEHVVDDVFIMVRRFDPSGPPEGRKFKIKARDADVYSSQDWDTASDDSQSMSTRSQETDATARL